MDLTSDIVCKRCGTVNNYTVEIKSNNHCAYCNQCGGFIKNLPYAEPSFYFGRYKNIKVSDVDDVPYLQWFIDNIKDIKDTFREAIQDQINSTKKAG